MTPGSHEEGDGRAFVVDDDAAICHSREVFASTQDFLLCGAIFGLRLPVGEASLLRNIALSSSPNAS